MLGLAVTDRQAARTLIFGSGGVGSKEAGRALRIGKTRLGVAGRGSQTRTAAAELSRQIAEADPGEPEWHAEHCPRLASSLDPGQVKGQRRDHEVTSAHDQIKCWQCDERS